MSAYTKGPYAPGLMYTNEGARPIMAMIHGQRTRIAMVDSIGERSRKTAPDAPDAERDANLRLFCAAPELVACLETLVKEGECYCTDHVAAKGPCGWCEARALLERVKGGPRE